MWSITYVIVEGGRSVGHMGTSIPVSRRRDIAEERTKTGDGVKENVFPIQ